MFGRNEIFGFVPHIRRRIGLVGVAVRLVRLLHHEGRVALRIQVGDMRIRLGFDPHSEAAYRAISHSSASTSAIGCPLT